jgi:hypothetical protein
MGQVSSKLRRATTGFMHWCEACEEMHILPDGWTFDGNLESPTFQPSFKHSGVQRVFVDGEWTGEWKRDADGKPIPYVCHYILTGGVLNYCGDCTHAMAGKSVPLPVLPPEMRDAP